MDITTSPNVEKERFKTCEILSETYLAVSQIIPESSNYHQAQEIKIVSPPNPHHIAWTGGSILVSNLLFGKWVTKQH